MIIPSNVRVTNVAIKDVAVANLFKLGVVFYFIEQG